MLDDFFPHLSTQDRQTRRHHQEAKDRRGAVAGHEWSKKETLAHQALRKPSLRYKGDIAPAARRVLMRSVLDRLISWTGLVMAMVLLAAGGLLSYASSYVDDQVSQQLSMQDITMPERDALETDAQHEALDEYAGQKMTDGDQAKAFADHYILEHMNAASEDRTYEEVSGEFIALSQDPDADPEQLEQLGQLRQTLFMGNTLRGLLLNAYAFDTMGEIAMYAAIASFIGAAVLILLALLGLRHAWRTDKSTATA